MRQIDFTKSAERSLRKLAVSDSRIAKAIKTKILSLLNELRPLDSLKMGNYSGQQQTKKVLFKLEGME